MACEDARVGDVGEAVPLHSRARKSEAAAGFAADRRVDGEGNAHVHGVAEGVADDGVRAVNAPGKAVARGRGVNLVFLRVVEVVDIEARLFFTKGCGRQWKTQ